MSAFYEHFLKTCSFKKKQRLMTCETNKHMSLKCKIHYYTFGIDISLDNKAGFPGFWNYSECLWI